MNNLLSIILLVYVLSLSFGAQQVWMQTNPLPCTTEGRDPARPWDHNSKVLDSFPKDDPLPVFVGTFRDAKKSYGLDIYRDSKGIFGQLSSPVLDADSPTSRLYDTSFDSKSGSLIFGARFTDGQLRFIGVLRNKSIEASIVRGNVTEKITLMKQPSHDEWFFTSRAQFGCAMTLWQRY